jgi:hypothetical protein
MGTGGMTMGMGTGGMTMGMGTGGMTMGMGTGGMTMGMGTGGMTMGMGTGGMTMGMGTGGSAGSGGSSGACHAPGTIAVTNSGMTAYVIDGASNPTLTLCRGSTYTFAVNAPGHPFYINTVQGTGTGNAYSSGVTGNGASSGNVVFAVPADAPGTLYYNCSLHAAMTGTIHIPN